MKKRSSIDHEPSTPSTSSAIPAGKIARTDGLVQHKKAPPIGESPPQLRTHAPAFDMTPRADESFVESIVGSVQRQGIGETPNRDVHDAASAGISGATHSLPHLDKIQTSFGAHDLAGVKAHSDQAASAAASSMGATAFASGDHVAFAGTPDLHTAAHEAAHVVQQRAGVQLKGGVGQDGDAYEQQADAVADAVVAGESAEDLLGKLPGSSASSDARPVQYKKQPGDQGGSVGGLGPVTNPPIDLTVEPSSVVFSNVGEKKIVHVTNTSDHDVMWNSQFTGDDVFKMTYGLMDGVSIYAGQTVPVEIEFRPATSGTFKGQMLLAADSTFMPQSWARLSLQGTAQAQPTLGTSISAKSPGGHANSIESAMTAVINQWEALLKEQIGGIELIQDIARKTDPPAPPSIWKDLLQGAIQLGVIGVTRAIALHVAQKLSVAVIRADLLKADNPADDAVQNLALVKAIEINERAHKIVTGQVVDTMQAQSAAALTTAIDSARGTKGGTSNMVREAFFEAMKTDLNFAVTDSRTAFMNTQGDYAALESKNPGVGFAALETYRNELAWEASKAKAVQTDRALGHWCAYLAKCDAGVLGEGKNAETDLYGDGGLATNESKRLGAREKFARGVIVLDMAWGNLAIKKARIRGINDELRQYFTTSPLRSYDVPIILEGNVLGTAGDEPRKGELRLGRNETGEYFHIIAETENDKRKKDAPGHGFMRKAARGDFGPSIGGDLGSGPYADDADLEKGTHNIFERILGRTLSEVEG